MKVKNTFGGVMVGVTGLKGDSNIHCHVGSIDSGSWYGYLDLFYFRHSVVKSLI